VGTDISLGELFLINAAGGSGGWGGHGAGNIFFAGNDGNGGNGGNGGHVLIEYLTLSYDGSDDYTTWIWVDGGFAGLAAPAGVLFMMRRIAMV
jgi:hypothetical protein